MVHGHSRIEVVGTGIGVSETNYYLKVFMKLHTNIHISGADFCHQLMRPTEPRTQDSRHEHKYVYRQSGDVEGF